MLDFIADIVTVNEGINYTIVLGFLLIYLVSIWLVIVVWVYLNARSRFRSRRLAFMWAFLVLVLNIPMLILYLILRPEEEWLNLPDGHVHDQSVPVVELQDANGVRVFLELKVITTQMAAVSTDQGELPTKDTQKLGLKLPKLSKISLKLPLVLKGKSRQKNSTASDLTNNGEQELPSKSAEEK